MEATSNILIGDVLSGLSSLPDRSIHCCVTSPPYWGLRDYGNDGQLGLEKTPDEYIAGMVAVFREVKRVLRDDGTLWLNIGDSYASGWACNRINSVGNGSPKIEERVNKLSGDLKNKDLVGIPWMLAIALRADGWYLRQDIIWRKPNPMPESVNDRCTKSHEYVFLLTKSQRYFYDAHAVAETGTNKPCGNTNMTKAAIEFANGDEKLRTSRGLHLISAAATRNRRSVWTIPSRSFRGAHFACFPPALVEPCILAGTSAHGCCQDCGTQWKRVTVRTKLKRVRPNELTKRTGEDGTGNSCANTVAGVSVETLGWEPDCNCGTVRPIPCTVLDPFSGSGTTVAVAKILGRSGIGMELNEEYAAMWELRLADVRKWWDKKNGKTPKKRKPASPRQGGLF